MEVTGAELFVKALKEENVDTLFAYPGGQVIDLFHALYGEEGIEVVLPRHEQGLIHAAVGMVRSGTCSRRGWVCSFYRKNGGLSCNKRARSYQSCDWHCHCKL